MAPEKMLLDPTKLWFWQAIQEIALQVFGRDVGSAWHNKKKP
jgi:hypothetical protein